MENLITNPTPATTPAPGPQGTEKVELTKEELSALLQKEGDKRVTAALAKAKEKWETEIGGKIDNHLKDYERKAQMTPEQLKQLDIEEKFKMLEAKEKEYQRMTQKMEISKMLQEKKLSTVLTDFVYDDNMEVVTQKVATLEQLILGMVNEEVEKRISTTKPKSSLTTGALTAEGFKKLSIAERSELYRTNPQLYAELSK